MPTKTATEELELIDLGGDARAPGGGDSGWGGGGQGDAWARALPQHVYLTGISLALAAILMFFMGLTSSYVVRKGLSDDWVAFALPRILWLNTVVLLASSVTLERARRFLGRAQPGGFRRWWGVTTALGILFLAGQVVAWHQLAAAGVYLSTNPSSSFFYVLTGAHGAHLLGGVIALLYVGFRRDRAGVRPNQRTAATASAIYWHFLGALWVFLFLLLLLGR
ncbi:MAG: heme-copper oxidase subunit III [Terriglobia bacterium]